MEMTARQRTSPCRKIEADQTAGFEMAGHQSRAAFSNPVVDLLSWHNTFRPTWRWIVEGDVKSKGLILETVTGAAAELEQFVCLLVA